MSGSASPTVELLLAELARLSPVVDAWRRRQPETTLSIEIRVPDLPPIIVEWQPRA